MGRNNENLLHIELRKELLGRGFKVQVSSWDREDLTRMTMGYIPLPDECASLELVLGEQDVWQIHINPVERVEPYDPMYVYEAYVSIVHATKVESTYALINFSDESDTQTEIGSSTHFDKLFRGNVNSVKELIRVMEQVSCPTSKSADE